MQKQHKRRGVVCTALLVVALASLALAGSAQAKLVEPFTKFQYCPWKNAEVSRCVYAVTKSGEVVLGSKKVPITKPVLIQGGFAEPDETTKISKFFGATEGKPTLQPVSQPVPGGLAGLVNCKEIKDFFLRVSCEATLENGFTGLNSTLELARPASEIKISEANLSRKEGVAMQLPVKIHLENPFLGSKCYVGSEGSPIMWNLTSGITSPKAPNKPIEGSAGQIKFLDEGLILQLNNNKLVDNNWSAPGASGCGGFLVELLLNPIINAAAGLPAAAGTNTAILNNTIEITTPFAMEYIEEQNP
jgi:hypothetical protein